MTAIEPSEGHAAYSGGEPGEWQPVQDAPLQGGRREAEDGRGAALLPPSAFRLPPALCDGPKRCHHQKGVLAPKPLAPLDCLAEGTGGRRVKRAVPQAIQRDRVQIFLP